MGETPRRRGLPAARQPLGCVPPGGKITTKTRGEGKRVAAAVSLSNVDVAFRLANGGAYRAVQDASLDVADGEFVAIVGPTGCGKSTLLNIAAGLLAPVAGRVNVYGAPLS